MKVRSIIKAAFTLFACAVFTSQALAAASTGKVVPVMLANGSNNLFVDTSTPVTLSLSLTTGGNTSPADWWIAYSDGKNLVWMNNQLNYTTTVSPVLQAPLQELPSIDIGSKQYPAGDHAYCFGVDTTQDGKPSITDPSFVCACAFIHVKASPPSTAGFTTAMLSGKTFTYLDSDQNSGTLTFNTDGTATGFVVGTWTINPSGQLVFRVTRSGNTATYTLITSTSTMINAKGSVSNGTTSTITLTSTTGGGGTPTTAATGSGTPSGGNTSGAAGLTAKDMTGTWTYSMDSYADTSGGSCKVSPTVTQHMECTSTYSSDCTITQTCSMTLNGKQYTLPSSTSKCDPNNATAPAAGSDPCNTQYSTVTNSTNPLSLTITGTINGAKYFVVTQTKK